MDNALLTETEVNAFQELAPLREAGTEDDSSKQSHEFVAPSPDVPSAEEAPVTDVLENVSPAFPEPHHNLTQDSGSGLLFDFNLGVRVHVPEGAWRVIIKDKSTESIVVEAALSSATIVSEKRYFIDARIEVMDMASGKICLTHDYNAMDRDVAIIFPVGTLGDAIGWMSYAIRFQEVHQCRLHLVVSDPIKGLFQSCYPHVNMLARNAFEAIKSKLYATYYLGLFFNDFAGHMQPNDFRLIGLHRTAGSILGVSVDEQPPAIDFGEAGEQPPIPEPYVVIAAQSSSQCKMWNYPGGWDEIVSHLKEAGYRVICIDREGVTGSGRFLNFIPNGVEDETGDRPLSERARWLRHATFFVGLSSGLSWLAWAARTPVVMISGFTHPMNEFSTPYRVFNHNVCNSCWHDVRVPFEHKNYTFCPRHKDTDRQFECSAKITPALVKSALSRVIADVEAAQNETRGREFLIPPQQRVDNPLARNACETRALQTVKGINPLLAMTV